MNSEDRVFDWVRIGAAQWSAVEGFDASLLSGIAEAVEEPDQIADADLLKKATRRLVFRFRSTSSTFLVKAFPLSGLKKRLQHRKYADKEATNLVRAKQLGLPVPELYAFGRTKHFGLVRWNALVTAFINFPSLEEQMEHAADPRHRSRLIASTYPFFRQLYETGCNHIDLKPGSFLINADGRGFIIDFQYATFLPEPSPSVLAAQAGHFARDVVSVNDWLDEAAMSAWFEGLLEKLGISSDATLRQIFERTSKRRFSIDERLQGVAGITP